MGCAQANLRVVFWIITGFYFLFTVNREQFRMSNWIPESCKQGLQLINKSSHVILIKYRMIQNDLNKNVLNKKEINHVYRQKAGTESAGNSV